MNKDLKVGILGTGYIANYHVEILKGIEGIEVQSCLDLNVEKAKSFGKRWGIPRVFDRLDEFIRDGSIDVAHVLVPPDRHYSIAKELLEGKVSVFLEKPMAETGMECQELVDIARKNDVTLAINQNSVFHPLFMKLLKKLEEGTIGAVHQVVSLQSGPLGQLDGGKFGHWMFQKPGNVLLEQGPHPIAQVRRIIGDPLEIKALVTGERELGKQQIFYDRWQCTDRCQRGSALIHLSFGNKYYPQSWLEVSGQDGSIRVDLLKNLYLVQKKSIFEDYLDPFANALAYGKAIARGAGNFGNYVLTKLGVRGKSDPFFLSMKNSIEAFYDAFKNGQTPPVSGEDGWKTIEFCEKWIDGAQLKTSNHEISEQTMAPASRRPEVLVTGATGFIGRKFVEHLVNQKVPVRVLVRSTRGLPSVFYDPMVEVFKGELSDPNALRQGVSGVHYVFHLAHSIGQTWEEFEEINVKGTRNLAQASIEEGVKYFVFTSTIAVYYYGDIKGGHVYDDTPIDSRPEQRNFYARSKILLEHMLKDMETGGRLPLVLFRPGIVVGDGGSPYHSGVGQWTRDNVCAYWGMGKNPLPFVLVDDVCSALARVIDSDHLEGKVFNLVGDVQISAREYIDYLKSYSKRKIHAFAYPMPLCFASEFLKYCVKALTGAHKDALLSYRDLSNRSISVPFENSRPKKDLDWQPCSTLKEFVEKGIGWAFNDE